MAVDSGRSSKKSLSRGELCFLSCILCATLVALGVFFLTKGDALDTKDDVGAEGPRVLVVADGESVEFDRNGAIGEDPLASEMVTVETPFWSDELDVSVVNPGKEPVELSIGYSVDTNEPSPWFNLSARIEGFVPNGGLGEVSEGQRSDERYHVIAGVVLKPGQQRDFKLVTAFSSHLDTAGRSLDVEKKIAVEVN